ncbi:MAG TPA: HAMP domain-containing sensor histidine kinase [Bellilinea sp.]
MENILSQIYKVLVEPPGNLIYHLVIVFAAMAGLQTVFLLDSPANQRISNRMKIGLLVILAGQVFLFIVSALGWQKIIDPHLVLPLMDRMVIIISLIWVGWMVINPPSTKYTDLAVGILTAGAFIFFAFTLVTWTKFAGRVDFNGSPYDANWVVVLLLISIAVIILLAYFRPDNWGTDLGFFAIVFAGGVLQLAYPYRGSDYPAAVRLAMICVFPLLPGIARKLKSIREPIPARARNGISNISVKLNSARAMHSWAKLAGLREPEQTCPNLVQALGLSVGADICAWINADQDTGPLTLECAYDLVKNDKIARRQIPRESLPLLTESLRMGKSIRLAIGDTNAAKDLDTLTFALGVNQWANVLAVPFHNLSAAWSGVVVLSPYTNRSWTDTDAVNLKLLCDESASILAEQKSASESKLPASTIQQSLEAAQRQLMEALEDRRVLLEELITLRQEREPVVMDVDLASIMAVQQEAHQTISYLEAENSSLRLAMQDRGPINLQTDSQFIEQELHTSLAELARLQNALAEANITIMNLQQRSIQPGHVSDETRRSVQATVEKLNSPVLSILAFTELLAGEGAGDLDPAQKSYIDRIHESADQVKALADELVQSTDQTASPVELASRQVAINPVIELAVNVVTPFLTEKGIDLQVTLPEAEAFVYADRDALQQILTYLLQNAAAVTPPSGAITLDAKVTSSPDDGPFLTVQVTDEGGGIPIEEIGKVFDREYRSEHPSIPGIGDRGVGLAITRTLVEAHRGRIWVESKDPGTSTFSVLLPVENLQTNGFNHKL